MKGELVIWGKHLLVDNIHEEIVDMLLISEKNIKYNRRVHATEPAHVGY